MLVQVLLLPCLRAARAQATNQTRSAQQNSFQPSSLLLDIKEGQHPYGESGQAAVVGPSQARHRGYESRR